jgi:hypothetical protein
VNRPADTDDDIFDSLFHGCAWAAYLDQAAEQQGPPDSEATKRRAYRYYEEELAARNAAKAAARRGDLTGPDDCPIPGPKQVISEEA